MLLSDLRPALYNPRKISDKKLEMLEKSLKEFGDLSGFVFNQQTGNLVGGHQRQKVMPPDAEIIIEQRFSPETSSGTIASGKVLFNGERFSYREVNWDLSKEKAANVAANQHGGDFDLKALEQVLIDLDEVNYDLDLTGFDAEEIGNLFDWPDKTVEGLTPEDEIPENVETRVKPGDIWQLGEHRLMCGDSTNIADIEKLMAGEKADMVFTSPPYGVGLDYNSYDDSFDNTLSVVQSVLLTMSKITSGYIALNWGDIVSGKKINDSGFPSQYSWLPIYNKTLNELGFYLWAQRIWKKPHARVSAPWAASSNRNVTDWEYLFTWSNGQQRSNSRQNDSHFGIIDSSESSQSDTLKDHPGAFPVIVAEKMIGIHTDKDFYIVDPFGGTGTTLIASEKTNRKCFMMELDPHYCSIILKRWEDFTGKVAVLVDHSNNNAASQEVPSII